MDIEKNGELRETGPAEIFTAVHKARAYGVIHFKGPGGETVFVTFKRGLAQHASGKGVEGEAAVQTVLTWREGEYRFIEDVMPDEEDFPVNVPPEVAVALGVGKAETLKGPAAAKVPPPPILAAGEPAGPVSAKSLAELFGGLEKEKFTGCCAVGPAAERLGLFLFIDGAAVGGLMWDCDSYRRGDEAAAALEKVFEQVRGELELFSAGERAASAMAVAFAGHLAITRMPSAAVNIEEYLSWARKARITGLVSIIAGEKAANILIKNGDVLGAVVAPDATVNTEPDEALALFYAREATVEAYAAKAGII
ncbi:MAG TPA: DUF4388 domain-containing protein [bacterium]|nr:DUF4388 domain-containing protein [bacterium]